MKSVNCIIIEDEYLARHKIIEYVSKIEALHTLGAFATLEAASKSGHIEACDIVLLDIDLPDGDGLELAKRISQKNKIIFTTAYSEYAVEGFNLNATDYLLKPIAFDRFKVSVEKAMSQLSAAKEKDGLILLKQGRSLLKCKLDDVYFIKGMQEYLYWKTTTGKIITLGSLTEYAKKLVTNDFVRIHKSFIVNLTKIEQVDTKTILVNGETLPLGPSFAKRFRRAYESYYNR